MTTPALPRDDEGDPNRREEQPDHLSTRSSDWQKFHYVAHFSEPLLQREDSIVPYLRSAHAHLEQTDIEYDRARLDEYQFPQTATIGPDMVVVGGVWEVVVSFGGPAAMGAFFKYAVDKALEWRKSAPRHEMHVKVGDIEITANNKKDLLFAIEAAKALESAKVENKKEASDGTSSKP